MPARPAAPIIFIRRARRPRHDNYSEDVLREKKGLVIRWPRQRGHRPGRVSFFRLRNTYPQERQLEGST